MANLRDLHGITDAQLRAAVVGYFYFVRMDFAGAIGTIYYTDKPGGFVGDIDGTGSHNWIEFGFTLTGIKQGLQTGLAPANISLININRYWGTLIATNTVRYIPVTVYHRQFDASGPLGTAGIPIYDGETDRAETDKSGVAVGISLSPSRVGWTKKAGRRYASHCIQLFRDPRSCQYAGADTSCLHTVADCTTKGNLANIVIFDKMPDSNVRIVWG